MEKMLDFLSVVILKTNTKYNGKDTLQDKVAVAADIRKLKEARSILRGLFYAYEDYEKHGNTFELPETKRLA